MANNYPQKALKFAMDTLFPIKCVGCGLYDTYFCASCLDGVKKRRDLERIGAVITFAATDYNDRLVEKALKTFKYGFVRDMAQPLAGIMRSSIEGLPDPIRSGIFKGGPLLVPVPLHKKRLNWRGFNQSEVLAEKISGFYGLEVKNILTRNKNRKPQADIEDRESRMNNIADSFECPANVNGRPVCAGRNIVLVDDICTTGATLNECAKVLAANGARKISALVIARG